MKLALPPFKLNDGSQIPAVGLGVWQVEPEDCVRSVLAALRAGYRHIDTAKIYENEQDVGRAIRESGVPRAEIFVTTKLWNSDQGHDSALRAFDGSLKALGLDYVDLYLLHYPVPRKRLESWRALEALKKSGRARSIGVSNFMVRHLEELLADSGVVPAVNQVEMHPWLFQAELMSICAKYSILVEAYSPLTQGKRLADPTLKKISSALEKSPAQVLIRWCLQHGALPLPKSVHENRIIENFDVADFEIPAAQMSTLNSLNTLERFCWDPSAEP